MQDAQSAAQLRAALAVLLPAEFGLSIKQTAASLGRNPIWVSRTRNQYLAGKTEFAGPEARGGRRNQLFPDAKEVELVKVAIMNAGRTWRSVRKELRDLFLKKSDIDPADSTITAILSRTAPKLLPDGDVWELQRWRLKLAEIYRAERDLHSMIKSHR